MLIVANFPIAVCFTAITVSVVLFVAEMIHRLGTRYKKGEPP